jgi:hypothetical protein
VRVPKAGLNWLKIPTASPPVETAKFVTDVVIVDADTIPAHIATPKTRLRIQKSSEGN